MKNKKNKSEIILKNGNNFIVIGKFVIGKNALFILGFLLLVIGFVIGAYAMDTEKGDYGYDNIINYTNMDYVMDELEVRNVLVNQDMNIIGDLKVSGVMTGTLSLGYHEEIVNNGNVSYHAFYLGILGEGGLNDEINYINEGKLGDVVHIFPIDSNSDIKLKHGTGNLDLDGADCNLKSVGNKAELRKSNGEWKLIVCLN